MRPLEILVFYVLVGLGIGIAFARSGRASPLVAGAFWPLFVPALLVPTELTSPVARGPIDRLREALAAWEPLPDGGIAALVAAERGLGALSRRRDEVDTLLRQPDNDLDSLRRAMVRAGAQDQPVYIARVRNLERLTAVRDEADAELGRALAAIEDLTTRVHLARLNGESTVDVARQLGDLAAAIDGAGEVRRLAGGG